MEVRLYIVTRKAVVVWNSGFSPRPWLWRRGGLVVSALDLEI